MDFSQGRNRGTQRGVLWQAGETMSPLKVLSVNDLKLVNAISFDGPSFLW